jgi:hypothetical protein
MRKVQAMSSRSLRAELGARNLQRAEGLEHEVTFGRVPSVVYGQEEAAHGNFLAASYRRIIADPAWAMRLDKTYTGSAQLPRARDRWRGELECAVSSDALLMNVFCYPGVLRRSAVCACLGVDAGERPSFGVRAQLEMQGGEVDRTEFDMEVGDLWVEAKLTEGGFGRASRARLQRYLGVEELFDVEELPSGSAHLFGYQIVRGLLAARQHGRRYLVLMDARREDLHEICFRVLRAVRDAEARSRFRLVTWQELACALPRVQQTFLAEKYGICVA